MHAICRRKLSLYFVSVRKNGKKEAKIVRKTLLPKTLIRYKNELRIRYASESYEWAEHGLTNLLATSDRRTQGGCTGCTCIPPLPSLKGWLWEKMRQWATRKKCKFVYLRLDNFLPRIITVKDPNFATATHNFDTRQGVPKILKNCRCFMVQERHPLSKAFKSEILLEMHKKN